MIEDILKLIPSDATGIFFVLMFILSALYNLSKTKWFEQLASGIVNKKTKELEIEGNKAASEIVKEQALFDQMLGVFRHQMETIESSNKWQRESLTSNLNDVFEKLSTVDNSFAQIDIMRRDIRRLNDDLNTIKGSLGTMEKLISQVLVNLNAIESKRNTVSEISSS